MLFFGAVKTQRGRIETTMGPRPYFPECAPKRNWPLPAPGQDVKTGKPGGSSISIPPTFFFFIVTLNPLLVGLFSWLQKREGADDGFPKVWASHLPLRELFLPGDAVLP